MTTERQKEAINFCETWAQIKFDGDIDNFKEVSSFLSKYLDDVKSIAENAAYLYYSNYNS